MGNQVASLIVIASVREWVSKASPWKSTYIQDLPRSDRVGDVRPEGLGGIEGGGKVGGGGVNDSQLLYQIHSIVFWNKFNRSKREFCRHWNVSFRTYFIGWVDIAQYFRRKKILSYLPCETITAFLQRPCDIFWEIIWLKASSGLLFFGSLKFLLAD